MIKKQLKIYNIEKSVQKFILVKKLLLCGDVESNPGPATYQQHRVCNNKFYLTAVKLGQKNCLQQYLGMNSGQFYYWKKKNLSCPKTSLLPKNKLSKMQKIKCRNQLFLKASSKIIIKEVTIYGSVSLRLADEELNINLVKATPDCVKLTCITFNRDDMYFTKEKRTDTLIWNSCKKKSRRPEMLMEKRRQGYEIIDNDYLYLVNPVYFNPRFPAPLMNSSLGNLNSVKLLGGGDDENKIPKSSGRKPKRKGFRGNYIVPVVSTSVLPKKLQNNVVIGQGLENTCFCNAALQVLFSLPKYTNFLNTTNYLTGSIGAIIKELCMEFLSQEDIPINTLQYLTRLELPDYIPYQQFDSSELFIHIMGNSFPNPAQNEFFKLGMHCTTICGECGYSIDNTEVSNILSLSVEESVQHSVRELIENYQSVEPVIGYRCDRCSRRDVCNKVSTIYETSEYIVLNLKIFNTSLLTGQSIKIKPNIIISESLTFSGKDYSLHGVIKHNGGSIYSGHYVSSVKSNNGWWHLNDIQRFESSSPVFQQFKDADPYVVVYKAANCILPSSTIEEPLPSPSCVSPLHKKSFGDEFLSTSSSKDSVSSGFTNLFSAVEKDIAIHDDLTAQKKRVVDEIFNFQQRQVSHSPVESNERSNLSNLKGKRSNSTKSNSERKRKQRSNQNEAEKLAERVSNKERAKQYMRNLRKNQTEAEKLAEKQ